MVASPGAAGVGANDIRNPWRTRSDSLLLPCKASKCRALRTAVMGAPTLPALGIRGALGTFLVEAPNASVAQASRPSSELMTELLPQPEMPSSITVHVNGSSESAPDSACTKAGLSVTCCRFEKQQEAAVLGQRPAADLAASLSIVVMTRSSSRARCSEGSHSRPWRRPASWRPQGGLRAAGLGC